MTIVKGTLLTGIVPLLLASFVVRDGDWSPMEVLRERERAGRLAKVGGAPPVRPGFTAWLTREGKCRLRYVNAGPGPAAVHTWTNGYTIQSDDAPKSPGDGDGPCVRGPIAEDWIVLSQGERHEWETSSYRAMSPVPLDPLYHYCVRLFDPTDASVWNARPKNVRAVVPGVKTIDVEAVPSG